MNERKIATIKARLGYRSVQDQYQRASFEIQKECLLLQRESLRLQDRQITAAMREIEAVEGIRDLLAAVVEKKATP